MQKLILVSVLVANIVIPLWAARERDAAAGLRKVLAAMLAFDVSYLLAVMFIYPRLQ